MTKTYVIAAAAAGCMAMCSASAEGLFSLRPLDQGSEFEMPATAQMSFANDKVTLFFYVQSENSDLSRVQSDVNAKVAAGEKAIRDFSSIVTIESSEYSAYPVWSSAKEGESAEIVGWTVRQGIKVTTEDVKGAASLVQVAQSADLALNGVNFSLREETRQLADDKLLAAALDALNHRMQVVAEAMNIPAEAIRIKKINFEGNSPNAVYAPRFKSYALDAANAVAAPSFHVGETGLSMTVRAVVVFEAQSE